MLTVGVPSVPEMDAAMALLELQYFSRETRAAVDAQQLMQTESSSGEMEEAAAAFSLTQLIGYRVMSVSNGTSYPDQSVTKVIAINNSKYPGNSGYIIKRNLGTKPKNLEPKCRRRIVKKNHDENRPLPVESPPKVKSEQVKKTCEIGTQTEEEYLYSRIADMEANIIEHCRKNKLLEEQQNRLKALIGCRDEMSVKIPVHQNTDSDTENDCANSSRRSYNRKAKTSITVASVEDSDDESDYKAESEAKEEDMDVSDDDSSEEQGYRNKVLRKVNNTGTSADLVPIGDGNAMVPLRLLRQIDWASYTNATRKLLTAVFSRRVLATHSLTGKPSPAFPDKPAKKKLESALVNDIIQTVVERCCVPENVVRTSITTKCADESKMLRSRQQNKKKRGVSKKENIPPTRSRSDSSAY